LEEYAEAAAKLWEGERHGKRKFTPAEQGVLALLQIRLSNKEIAAKMEISERTVKFHLGNIFRKMDLHDRYSLIDMLRGGKLGALGDALGQRKDTGA
jgi:DNA-binding NarL/FixJ family response regulator